MFLYKIMGRIMALDFGEKRTGIAVTDELQIIATPVDTLETKELFNFFETYFAKEKVSELVIGLPMKFSGEMNPIENEIQKFILKFKQSYPQIPIYRENEMFTSKMALQTQISGGMKKKDRQSKGSLDKISATIILQSFLSKK